MKTKILLFAILIFSIKGYTQTWQWTHPEKNSYPPNNQYAHDIETDASGNVYVLGEFYDSLFLSYQYVSGTAGKSGSYLAKYDSSGNLQWNKLITSVGNYGTKPIVATDLAITANGVYITGKYFESYWDSYDCTTGGSGGLERSYKIGNYSFVSAKSDIGFFVAKLNFNGGVVWNKTATRPMCYSVNGHNYYNNYSSVVYTPLITSDKNNNIVCEFLNGGNYANSISISGYSITVPTPTNNLAFVVFKMNTNGTVLWSNYAANSESTSVQHDCNSMITDNNGNTFLYGLASDSCRFGNIYYETHYRENESGIVPYSTFIAKISSSGVWQFAKELCIDSHNILDYRVGNPDFLATDNNNNIYALVNHQNTYTHAGYTVIMGDTLSTNETAYFLVKVNNTGNLVWHKGFGTTPQQGGAESIYYANNSLYISGSITYSDSWHFSNLNIKLPSSDYWGSTAYFVSKADTSGSFKWVTSFASPYNYMSGFAVKAFNENVYTAGIYRSYISTLGNLNGTYSTDYNLTDNIFFGKLKDQYIRVGAVTPTALIPGCTISVPFTSYGLNFSSKNKFFAVLSDANGDFTNTTTIGNVKSKNSSTITATIPASLSYGSGYRIRIRSSDTLATGYNYYAYADTGYALTLTCPAPSSGLAESNITATSATLNWDIVDCASGYRLQYRVKGSNAWITAVTTTNNIIDSFNLTGLANNTTYQWRIKTRCKNNGILSYSAYTSSQQFKTTAGLSFNNAGKMKNDNNSLEIMLLPNPATTNAVFVFNANKPGKYMLELMDVSGKLLKKITGESIAGDNSITIDVSRYPRGMYLVVLTNDEHGRKAVKLYKE